VKTLFNIAAKGGIVGSTKCPVPTCNTTKSRVKGRLRHLPKKWSILPKDSKEAISNELRKFNSRYFEFSDVYFVSELTTASLFSSLFDRKLISIEGIK
jgi:hypothetical protein